MHIQIKSHPCINTNKDAYIQTNINTCVHKNVHIHIQTYMRMLRSLSLDCRQKRERRSSKKEDKSPRVINEWHVGTKVNMHASQSGHQPRTNSQGTNECCWNIYTSLGLRPTINATTKDKTTLVFTPSLNSWKHARRPVLNGVQPKAGKKFFAAFTVFRTASHSLHLSASP